MKRVLDPFRFLLIAVAGWMNQAQEHMIDYLREENRVLREQIGERRLRLNDDQRRRLAAKAKGLSRKRLAEVAGIVEAGGGVLKGMFNFGFARHDYRRQRPLGYGHDYSNPDSHRPGALEFQPRLYQPE